MNPVKFGNNFYDENMTLSEFAKRLEVEQGFRVNFRQFSKLVHNKELTAQEIIDMS